MSLRSQVGLELHPECPVEDGAGLQSVKAAEFSWCGHLGSHRSTRCNKVILAELAPHWGGKAGPSPPNIYSVSWWNQEWQGGFWMFLNHGWESGKSCCGLFFTLGAWQAS